MKKNSFGQGLTIFFVIIGVLFVIGSIGEASEPKCIKAGCDNKQASGSSYCYLQNHIREAVHPIAVHHIAINHLAVLLRVAQVTLVQTVVTIINQIQQTSHHIAAAQRKVQRQRRVHMILMMMV